MQVAIPIRVCYLVPFDAPSEMLSAIFKECYERWGGRDSLIVPVRDGIISVAYWRWARAIDPDVVYSYVAVDEALLKQIDRTWMPSVFKCHVLLEGHPDFVPRYGVDALKTLSVLPSVTNRDQIGPQMRPALLSQYQHWAPDMLVADSFGVNPFGPGTAQVIAVRKHVDLFAVGTRAPEYYGEAAERSLQNSTEVLKALTERAWGQLTMAQLSGIGYEELHHFCESGWIGSFSVVIGDMAMDRIAFWNGRVGFADYFRRNIIAIHLSKEDARDSELLSALQEFIISANPWGSNGTNPVTVRSSSVDDELLQSVAEALRPYLHVTVSNFIDADACAPENITQPVFVRQRTLERYTEGYIPLRPAAPAHMTGQHAPSSFLAGGGWSVEIMVYRETSGARNSSNLQVRYPRRWQAVRPIVGGAIAKTSVTGGLKIVVSEEGRSHVLQFSDDDTTYVAGLFAEPHYLWADDPRGRLGHAKIHTRISEAGRRLLGFLNRLGDLRSAHDVLGDEFWKSILEQMAVPRAMSEDTARADIGTLLGKALEQKRITGIGTVEEREALAEVVAAIVQKIPAIKSSRPFKWFVSEYKKTNEAARLKAQSANDEAWDQAVVSKVRDELQDRCTEGVLIQGYAWSCRRCLHANWLTVDAVKKFMPCEVCEWQTSIATSFEWTFRLDEYVADGIYMRGLRGLVWALGSLSFIPRYSFEYSPPLDLLEDGRLLTDADIACVRDGLFIVGEVKESARNINDGVGNSLIDVARKILPDVVVIACMDDSAFNKVKEQVDRVRNELNDPLIGVLGVTPNNEYGNPGGIFMRVSAVAYVSAQAPQPSAEDWSI